MTQDVTLNNNGISTNLNGTNGLAHAPNESINGSINGTTNGMANGQNDAPRVQNDSASRTQAIEGIAEPIAIVGMGMRLPGGSNDAQSFWSFLINKRDARMRVPQNRFNIDGFYSTHQKAGSIAFDHGYFIDADLDRADAGFFTATKAEVEALDPQQRLLLEVVYEAFQNAGEVNWRGKSIGCYAGVYSEDWHDLHAMDALDSGMYRTTGAGDFVLANRVSYEYDLRGPR